LQQPGSVRTARDEWRSGWKLVLAATAGSSLAPVMYYTVGVFVEPLETEFGWSRTLITSGLTVFAVISVILAGPAGALIDRFGPRRIALPGTVIYCAALAGLSTAGGSELQWWALWVAIAAGALLVKTMVWSAAIVSRFEAARGFAMAIALCGAGLTGIFAPMVSGYLIEHHGWRLAYVGIAALWFAVAMPLLLFFFFGASDLQRTGRTAGATKARPPGVPLKEAVKSTAFARLASGTFLVMLVITGCTVHFVSMVTQGGLERSTAVGLASVIGLAAFLGRLFTGSMLDRFRPTLVGGSIYSLPAAACLMLLAFDGSSTMAFLVAALIGFCSGAEVEIASYLSARFFGMRSFGTLFGLIAGLISLATGLGPVLAGFAFDHSGAYTPALWVGAPAAVLAGFLVFTLGRQPHFAAEADGQPDAAPAPGRT